VQLVDIGQIYLGCAVRILALSLPVNLCRRDSTCGIQFACVDHLAPYPRTPASIPPGIRFPCAGVLPALHTGTVAQRKGSTPRDYSEN